MDRKISPHFSFTIFGIDKRTEKSEIGFNKKGKPHHGKRIQDVYEKPEKIKKDLDRFADWQPVWGGSDGLYCPLFRKTNKVTDIPKRHAAAQPFFQEQRPARIGLNIFLH
jgi:hypothetical protein